MPLDHPGWSQLRAHAAAQLPGDFADRVLRAARLEASGSRVEGLTLDALLRPVALAFGTLVACLAAVVFFHAHSTRAATERHLADWLEISSQSICLADTP